MTMKEDLANRATAIHWPDGFSPDDVDRFLELTGKVCPEVAGYRFANVTQLARDFEQGRFAAAFPPRKSSEKMPPG